jgi:hypothetical protein
MQNKRVLVLLTSLLSVSFFDLVFAEGNGFFSIQESCHIATPYQVRICLNGKGQISCQNYTAYATHLTIKTTIPQQTYSFIGIKAESALYSPINCTNFDNGYCLFSASDSIETTIIMQPQFTFNQLFVC